MFQLILPHGTKTENFKTRNIKNVWNRFWEIENVSIDLSSRDKKESKWEMRHVENVLNVFYQ